MRTNTVRNLSAALIAGTLLLFSSAAGAANINYGDFIGTTVTYLDVTEDALTAGDSPPLFGAPTVVGDSLDFNPNGFSANASGIVGLDSTDGELTMLIEAKPGEAIEGFSFSEAGEFDLFAAFNFESNNAFASVTGTIFIDILGIDGSGYGGSLISDVFEMSFTDDGEWLLSTDGSGIPLRAEGIWSGGIEIDLIQMMDDARPDHAGHDHSVTKVGVTIDNRLLAVSDEGTEAFIAKKDFKGLSITAIPELSPGIPEPSTGMLLALGLVTLAARRRRS